ncbi:MAG: glycosyltransferase family 4 protein [Anaerolineae bacterium]|nr:glycosyltransferase family 4 protein [Anaerolineae bacterium]MDW8067651.1 glycosyltransferase family 4 protein [Anaerolineae bacterium]
MLSHYMLPHRGGIEIIVDRLSRDIAEQGYEVTVISSRWGQAPRYEVQNHRRILRVAAIDPLRKRGAHYPLFSPQIVPLLVYWMKHSDIVHAHGMLYLTTFLGITLARCLKRASVLTEHAGFVAYENRMLEMAQKMAISTIGLWNLKLSQQVLVHEHVVEEYLRRFCLSHLHLIPLGVDTRIFHPVSVDTRRYLRTILGWDDRPKVLFVGNFVLRKRVELLLQASDPAFDVVLCGEGYPLISQPHILIYPPLSHPDLVRLYQAADLFVVPSSIETFCIVAYEAMACGLPVVMTTDLLHLSIAQSNLITFVDPTPSSLRQAILELLRDPGLRFRTGEASAEWVRAHFSWEQCVKQHMRLYEALLESRKSSSSHGRDNFWSTVSQKGSEKAL